MTDSCLICGLSLEKDMPLHPEVINYQEGEAHAHCKVLLDGLIPECPLAGSIDPPPSTDDCCQALTPEMRGDCICENMGCQIGFSVRILRKKGIIG